VLAGIEEALQVQRGEQAEEEMTAIDSLLAGLFDYAGLYPPASLGMLSAANNYLEYSRGKHAAALGRLIVNVERLGELRSAVGAPLRQFRLSVIVTESGDWDGLGDKIREGFPIETVEIKCGSASDIERIAVEIPRQITTYFEIPLDAENDAALDAVAKAGARAKIRMGGVVPEALPAIPDVVRRLESMAKLRLPFKATAGLHHPVRSQRALTYQKQSPQGMMHGFMNMCCAAALCYFGGDAEETEAMLGEQDESAWQVSAEKIQWHDQSWTADQLSEMRSRFFISIGSCSFEEPMHDLESLGWL
jgi:hypothetical protein